jgi:hypothetical protein
LQKLARGIYSGANTDTPNTGKAAHKQLAKPKGNDE